MSNFPTSLDDDTTLPIVYDNITEIGEEAINALRDAVFNIQKELGITGSGTTNSVSDRLGISINPDGSIKSSALTSLGLVTLPITNSQIADNAAIPESKLKLDHKTGDLFNYIRDLSSDINFNKGWISTTGSKLNPHINGTLYKHGMEDVLVSDSSANYMDNKFNVLRDNSNSYTLVNSINTELLLHHWADGTTDESASDVITIGGSTFPSNYAHHATGIFIDTSRFSSIPQTAEDMQELAEFIDSSGTFLIGTRIQNLYTNGISRLSRSSSLVNDGYGIEVVPDTLATTYLLEGGSTSPVDDIDHGDDIIELTPAISVLTTNAFDQKFAKVKVGDIIRVNYGSVEVSFLIKERKYVESGGSKRFIIRIAGKNLFATTNASVRIDRSLINYEKYGVLAVSPVNNQFDALPSLIIGSPRGAQATGIGFNASNFNSSHYLLYLAIYPTGDPSDGYTILPPIDVTGDSGQSQGKYTLNDIVQNTNNAFRLAGYNYRFIAYAHEGEFGIMLADSTGNAGFSVLSGLVDGNGNLDEDASELQFPNNVVGLFATSPDRPKDPLGFGPSLGNIASPPYQSTYLSPEQSLNVTRIYLPLKRNTYYVDGTERDRLNLEIDQTLDDYGDGYWLATIQARTEQPGPPGRVETRYRIPIDLSTSKLQVGKTIVVKHNGSGGLIDNGRFIIKTINFGCDPEDEYTDITVYDAVHAFGSSPTNTLGVGGSVSIYFNASSVGFNAESATDTNALVGSFKRHFEVYVDADGDSFTHERARINITGNTININGSIPLHSYSELAKMHIIDISPKLRGYQYGSVNKIALRILSFDATTGYFSGYLANYDGSTYTDPGNTVVGRYGNITRFYDSSNVDYVDILFDNKEDISTFTDKVIDIQLFPTLSLDQELLQLISCELNGSLKTVDYIIDKRQFGNTSEKDFTTSALDYISAGDRHLHMNGLIRGFELETTGNDNPTDNQIYLNGGSVFVNGNIIHMNAETISIPYLWEFYQSTYYAINWLICVNDKGEYELLPLLDDNYGSFTVPSVINRVFLAHNAITGDTYRLNASTFSDVVNKHKNLTPLYVASSLVSNTSGITIDVDLLDVRRYVNDSDSNLPLRLTSGESQGNFRSVHSILNWIQLNNEFNGVALIKGANETFADAITLDFSNSVIIDGQNNATLVMDDFVTIGSNITVKNLTITFNTNINIRLGCNRVLFENCIININNSDESIFRFFNSNNIVFKECAFVISNSSANNTKYFMELNNVSNFKFIDCTMEIEYTDLSVGTKYPGDVFIIKNSDDAIISDCSISGNFTQFIVNVNSNNQIYKNLYLSSSYDPNGETFVANSGNNLSTLVYDANDYINSGRGWIYCNVVSEINNIIIENVSFDYNPSSAQANRLTFINFELSTSSSLLKNLTIDNCKFRHLNTSSSVEDYRAAVAIINTVESEDPETTVQIPAAKNIKITNNYCNRSQMIVLTSVTDDTGEMLFPGLYVQGATVKDNICGTIGYWISSGVKIFQSTSYGFTAENEKDAGLDIVDNTCHYICSMDSTGQRFIVSLNSDTSEINRCEYPSGNVKIEGNKANWIHTGIARQGNATLQIKNNSLNAYTQDYIQLFDSTLEQGLTAIAVSSTRIGIATSDPVPDYGRNCFTIITGNNIDFGYWSLPSIFAILFTYTKCISVDPSCIITNNILKGISSSGVMLELTGGNMLVKNNMFFRTINNIDKYITLTSVSTKCIITDNFFDSHTTTEGSTSFTNETLVEIPDAALGTVIYSRNINQTEYVSIPVGSNNGNYFADPGSSTYYFKLAPGSSSVPTEFASDGYFVGYKSQVTNIHDAESPIPADPRQFGWQYNLDSVLPPDVRILKVELGIRRFSGVQLTTSSSGGIESRFIVLLNKYNHSRLMTSLSGFANTTTPDPNIVNDNNGDTQYAVVYGSDINSTLATQLATIDLDASNDDTDYATNKGYGMSVSIDAVFKRSSGTAVDLYMSPIVIKYRW